MSNSYRDSKENITHNVIKESMTFNWNQLDLNNTPFTIEQLQEAQLVLKKSLSVEWIDNPEGYIAELWKKGDAEAISFFIGISLQLKTFLNKTDERSRKKIHEKLNHLFNCKSEQQFYEAHIEWSALDMLACRASSIELEPLQVSKANPKKSPDSLIHTLHGSFYAEITVFNFSYLENHKTASVFFTKYFTEEANKRQADKETFRKISLHIPTALELNGQKVIEGADLIEKIIQNDAGKDNLICGQKEIPVEWYAVSTIDERRSYWPNYMRNNLHQKDIEFFQPPLAQPILIKKYIPLISIFTKLELTKIINAISNKLRDKADQFKISAPYILIFNVYDSRVPPDCIIDQMHRFWEQGKYKWVSGVIAYFKSSAKDNYKIPPIMRVSLNPNADHPISEKILSVNIFEFGHMHP